MNEAQSSETLMLFPTALHVTHHMQAAEMNAKIKAAISSVYQEVDGQPPREMACTMYSTMATEPSLHLRAEFAALTDFVQEEAQSFADALDYVVSTGGTSVRKCWLNILRRGDSCDLFNDANSIISGVYFVNSTAGGARMQLHAPIADEMIVIQKSKITDLNAPQIFFDGEAGDLLLFPSHLIRSWTLHNAVDDLVMLNFTICL